MKKQIKEYKEFCIGFIYAVLLFAVIIFIKNLFKGN